MMKCVICDRELKEHHQQIKIAVHWDIDQIQNVVVCSYSCLNDWAADHVAEHESDYDDPMDGDHESALKSAGFGTDEDCGDFGDNS